MVFSYRKWEYYSVTKIFRMVVFDSSQMKQNIILIDTFIERGLQTSGARPELANGSLIADKSRVIAIRDNNPEGIYIKGNFTMQKVIDWYFLIVSSVITIMSFCFCIQDNNWGNILLFCFSVMVSILYIINILKTSAFFDCL